MIKSVYCTRNVKSANYNAPQLYDFKDQETAKEAFTISLTETPAMQKEMVKELDFYYLGEFDTKTGKFNVVEPEFILSAASVLNE